MKLKSAAGHACYVRDLDKTAEFYEKLGLEVKSRSQDRLIVNLNWYRMDFVLADTENSAEIRDEAALEAKGAGVFFYFSVDDVDQAYAEIVSSGIKPITEPTDRSWGNREFLLRDPDGYKIVIFVRKNFKAPKQ